MKTLKTFLKNKKVVFICSGIPEIQEYMGKTCVGAKYAVDWGYL